MLRTLFESIHAIDPEPIRHLLAPARAFCGGDRWYDVLTEQAVPRLPPAVRVHACALVGALAGQAAPARVVNYDHGAITVRDGLLAAIATLPEQLRKSLTWDQGTELAKHRELTLATKMDIYFCDPHSPLAARQQREHCECQRWLGWAVEPGWCRQLEVNCPGFDAASFLAKDADHAEEVPSRAA